VLYLIIEGWRERGGVKVAGRKSEDHAVVS
jgi:hypothetical protein